MELNDIASKFLSDETREKLVKDVIRLSNDELIFDEYEQMMGDKLIEYEEEQSLLEEGYDSGFQDGINTGIEQNKLEMIERMLKNKVDYETISQITEKTIEQIKEIEKGLE